jgi:hypothetical protein
VATCWTVCDRAAGAGRGREAPAGGLSPEEDTTNGACVRSTTGGRTGAAGRLGAPPVGRPENVPEVGPAEIEEGRDETEAACAFLGGGGSAALSRVAAGTGAEGRDMVLAECETDCCTGLDAKGAGRESTSTGAGRLGRRDVKPGAFSGEGARVV